MGIETNHPEYATRLKRVQRVRDAMGGQDAVHAAAERYLARLTDQSDAEYHAYKSRAGFFNATQRTAEALHGLIHRKPITVKAPSAAKAIVDDFTLAGDSLDTVASSISKDVLGGADLIGVLVDHPPAVPVSNAAQAAALGQRSFGTVYLQESIVNWRYGRVNNQRALTLVVLAETHTEISADGFSEEGKPQRRALKLVDGVYVQEVWREGTNGWALIETITPLMRGRPLPYIPFFCDDLERPLLLDLADVNLSHYRTSADLEHGAHMTGLPQPWVAGYQKMDEDEKLVVGGSHAWVFGSSDASCGYLEFTGQGLGALEKLLDRKEAHMAQLGARMLTPTKSGVESAQALDIRATGETSMLGALAGRISRLLSRALRCALEWNGIAGEASVTLNTDFVTSTLDAPKLTALVAAWQAGAISAQTLFYNLKQGEAIEDAVDFETEQGRIGEQAPALTPPAATV